MAITVEYGKCDKCGDNNVKTAQLCRSCTSALPWARPKQTKQSAPAGAPQNSFTSAPLDTPSFSTSSSSGMSAGFYVQILGALVFAAGVLIFIGNVTRIYPTIPVGYYGILIGGAIWRGGASMGND